MKYIFSHGNIKYVLNHGNFLHPQTNLNEIGNIIIDCFLWKQPFVSCCGPVWRTMVNTFLMVTSGIKYRLSFQNMIFFTGYFENCPAQNSWKFLMALFIRGGGICWVDIGCMLGLNIKYGVEFYQFCIFSDDTTRWYRPPKQLWSSGTVLPHESFSPIFQAGRNSPYK